MDYKFYAMDLKTFKALCKMTDKQLFHEMLYVLKRAYGKDAITYRRNKFIAAKGTIPLILVAHLDTVFQTPPTGVFDILYDRDLGIINSYKGLGADDRAGVYGILKLLGNNKKNLPSVLFTMDEEIGGLGAIAASKMSVIELFGEKPKYIIELDRQGINDAVFYDCDNKPFVEYVESFGFMLEWGTFTDISILCPVWECAGVNLSIGYVNEHSVAELFFPGDWSLTLEKVQEMIDEINEAPYFEYIPAHDHFGYFKKLFKEQNFCDICDTFGLTYDAYAEGGYKMNVCADCLVDYFTVCPSCGKMHSKTTKVCSFCNHLEKEVLLDEV